MRLSFTLPLLWMVLAPASGEKAHKGALDDILDKLKVGDNLHHALQYVETIKVFSQYYKSLTTFSPLIKDLFERLAKSNPKYKVDMDLVEGRIPTLVDLYDLVKSRNLHIAFTSVLSGDPKFQEVVTLFNKTDFQNSKDDIERSIFLITGHKIDVSSAMVLDSTSDKWKVTRDRDSKSRNLVEVMLLWHDIWNPYFATMEIATQSTFSLEKLIEAYLRVNYTRLNEISGLPISGEKYTVKGKGEAGTDPAVSQILQLQNLVQTNFNNQNYVEALKTQASANAKMVELFNRALEQALADTPNIVG